MVRVSDNVQGRFPVERIRGCSFHGPVVIGDLVGEVRWPGVEGELWEEVCLIGARDPACLGADHGPVVVLRF